MRAQHIMNCVWLFWPITLLVLIGIGLLIFSTVLQPAAIPVHVIHSGIGNALCTPVSLCTKDF